MKKFAAVFVAALMMIPLSLVFSTAAETNIAQGKSYVATGKYVDNNNKWLYPDDTGKKLTDGVIGSTKDDCVYNKDIWVGLNWHGENTDCNEDTWNVNTTISINYITVDLAEEKSSLTKFVLYALQTVYGVDKPKTVEVLISSNGTDYTSVGTATETKVVDANDASNPTHGIYAYTVTPSTAVSAKFVKFKITAGGGWTHVSEVQVFQGEETGSSSSSSAPTEKVPAETYSLISLDASQWLTGDCVVGDVTEKATVTNTSDAIIVSGSQQYWPYGYYNIPAADQHKVKMSDFKLSYKFTVEDGKTNIILFCEGATVEDNKTYINDLTHFIVPDGDDRRNGDDLIAGTYEGSVDLADLKLHDATLTEEGYITISAVKVFTVGGGKVTLEKLALESYATKDVPVNTSSSSSTPSSSTSTSGSSSSSPAASASSSTSSKTSSGQTKVGDTGISVFAVLTVVSLAGMSAVSLKKRKAGQY